jgi:hypothetical protein
MQVRARRRERQGIAVVTLVAGLALASACSDIPEEPVRTGELAPTPTPLPRATPAGEAAGG